MRNAYDFDVGETHSIRFQQEWQSPRGQLIKLNWMYKISIWNHPMSTKYWPKWIDHIVDVNLQYFDCERIVIGVDSMQNGGKIEIVKLHASNWYVAFEATLYECSEKVEMCTDDDDDNNNDNSKLGTRTKWVQKRCVHLLTFKNIHKFY